MGTALLSKIYHIEDSVKRQTLTSGMPSLPCSFFVITANTGAAMPLMILSDLASNGACESEHWSTCSRNNYVSATEKCEQENLLFFDELSCQICC